MMNRIGGSEEAANAELEMFSPITDAFRGKSEAIDIRDVFAEAELEQLRPLIGEL